MTVFRRLAIQDLLRCGEVPWQDPLVLVGGIELVPHGLCQPGLVLLESGFQRRVSMDDVSCHVLLVRRAKSKVDDLDDAEITRLKRRAGATAALICFLFSIFYTLHLFGDPT